MAQPDYDPGPRYWENMAHVMFGDNNGERLTLDERRIIQGMIRDAVKMRSVTLFAAAARYVCNLFKLKRERNDRMVKDHNDAIIRHGDHARWRLLYRRVTR